MPPRKEKELPFSERLNSAVQDLGALATESATYDSKILSASFNTVLGLADEGLEKGELDQVSSVDIKLQATQRAREIGEANGDTAILVEFSRLETAYDALLKVLRGNSGESGKPATTSAAKSGRAKTPKAT